jgi:site-specific recombinase XerD
MLEQAIVVAGMPPGDAGGRLVDAIVNRAGSPHTRRAYLGDLRAYADWLATTSLRWDGVTSDDLERYRSHLSTTFARATANRRLTVVRALYDEAFRGRLLDQNPGDRLRGVRGRDERDGGSLTREEARRLMTMTQRDLDRPGLRLITLRDIAILGLLIRTGLRRFELVGLRVRDADVAVGHHVLTIRAGKGNVTRTVKLPTDVHRSVTTWLAAAAEAGIELAGDEPLFVEVRKGGTLTGRHPLSDRAVHRIVARRLRAAGLPTLGPHALRATFVTLALEGGAPLHLVQHAAGHADPRTTERYWQRKGNLDDNAVDYIKF